MATFFACVQNRWMRGRVVCPPYVPSSFVRVTGRMKELYSFARTRSTVKDRVCCFRSSRSTIETVEVASVWGPPTAEEATLGSTATAVTPGAAAATPASTLVTVRYILRVEDIGTGREWLVFPQYSDFSELHQELLMLWPPVADLPFPAKRPAPRATALGSGAVAAPGPGGGDAVVEERGGRLEAFLDGVIALLGIYASIDSR